MVSITYTAIKWNIVILTHLETVDEEASEERVVVVPLPVDHAQLDGCAEYPVLAVVAYWTRHPEECMIWKKMARSHYYSETIWHL